MVCSGLGSMSFTITFRDEHNNRHSETITTTIVESKYQLIIGRNTMTDLNITEYFPCHFKNAKHKKDTNNTIIESMIVEDETGFDGTCSECTLSEEPPKSNTPSVDYLNIIAQTALIRTTLTREDRDEDGIDENELSVFPWNNFQTKQTMPNLYGSQEFSTSKNERKYVKNIACNLQQLIKNLLDYHP